MAFIPDLCKNKTTTTNGVFPSLDWEVISVNEYKTLKSFNTKKVDQILNVIKYEYSRHILTEFGN